MGPELVDRVLATGGPGRGRQDLALVGEDAPLFGAAPVDPAALPAEELVRHASGVLADLVVDHAAPPANESRPRLIRPRYLFRGDPWLTRSARVQLLAQGKPPGGPRPRALIVVAPVEVYCADVWAAIAANAMVPRWSTWLARLDEQLPPRVDPVVQAGLLAKRVGRRKVEICVGLDPVAELLDASVETPQRLSHAALDAMRHVRGVLRVTVGEPGARALMGSTLVPWLGASDDPGLPRPGVPRQQMPWLRAEAVRWQSELAAAGYAVHGGGLDELTPADPVRTTPPSDDEVLHVMLRTLQQSAGRGRTE